MCIFGQLKVLLKIDGRNSWFKENAVENKDGLRGARKLFCGVSILFVFTSGKVNKKENAYAAGDWGSSK